MPQIKLIEDRWRWLRTTGMLTGFMLAAVGPITLFGRSKRTRDYMFESLDAFPWATALSLFGAILLLWACWKLPKLATGGAALAVILLVVTAVGLTVGSVRLDWSQTGPGIGLSIAGQILTLALLIGSAVQCGRKRPEQLR